MEGLFILLIYNFITSCESCATFRCLDGSCLARDDMVCDYYVDCSQGEDEFWCAGEKGYPGITGENGIKGSTGPRGDRGDQGIDGPNGDTGSPGSVGPNGDSGALGDIGFPGDDGPIGSQGPRGQTGLTGAFGESGEFGPQGDSGLPGDAGQVGDPGERGHSTPVVMDRCSPSPCQPTERCITVENNVFCTPLIQNNDYWGVIGEELTITVSNLSSTDKCIWSRKDPAGTFFSGLDGNPSFQTNRTSLKFLNPMYNDTRIYRCSIENTNRTYSFLVQIGTIGMGPCSKSCGLGESFLSLLCNNDMDGRSYCSRLSEVPVPCLNERPCPSCVTCFGGNCAATFYDECSSPFEKCLNIFDTASGIYTYRGCDRLGLCELVKPVNNNLRSIDIAGKELVPFCN